MKPSLILLGSVGCCIVAATLFLRSQRVHGEASAAVPPPKISPEPPVEEFSVVGAKVDRLLHAVFKGGLVFEGLNFPALSRKAVFSCRGHALELEQADPPVLLIPADLVEEPGALLEVALPGWKTLSIQLPPADEKDNMVLTSRLEVARERGSLKMSLPATAADYDTAEMAWIKPLDPQSPAEGSGAPVVIPLNFRGERVFEGIPTGTYSVTLLNRACPRVKGCQIEPTLSIVDSSHSSGGSRTVASVYVPASIDGAYVGCAATLSESSSKTDWVLVIIGVRFDIFRGTGSLMTTFVPLEQDQNVAYKDLRPRPDEAWPISNIVLMDPTRLEFDCPLSHIDHHFTLWAADGVMTLKKEMMDPEAAWLRDEMRLRMLSLLKNQTKLASQDPARFDPFFALLPAEQLPAFRSLSTVDAYTDHLRRLSLERTAQIELGGHIKVVKDGAGLWNICIRQHGE